MKVNKRFYKLAPPSFPKHYDKEETKDGYVYQSIFYSVASPSGMYLRATNEWGDYMGDIIYAFAEDIEKLLADKPPVRPELNRRNVIRQKMKRNVPLMFM